MSEKRFTKIFRRPPKKPTMQTNCGRTFFLQFSVLCFFSRKKETMETMVEMFGSFVFFSAEKMVQDSFLG